MVVALTAPVDFEPLAASAPVQPPLAWQAVALVEVQVSVEEPPAATEVGLAVNVAMGTTLTVTDTVELDPPAPVQTIENVVLTVMAAVAWLPFAASAPLHPPEAWHAVALVDVQVSVVVAPLFTEVEAALRVAVGTAGGAALLPPPPPQAFKVRIAAKAAYWIIELRKVFLSLLEHRSVPIASPHGRIYNAIYVKDT